MITTLQRLQAATACCPYCGCNIEKLVCEEEDSPHWACISCGCALRGLSNPEYAQLEANAPLLW